MLTSRLPLFPNKDALFRQAPDDTRAWGWIGYLARHRARPAGLLTIAAHIALWPLTLFAHAPPLDALHVAIDTAQGRARGRMSVVAA